MSSVHRAPSVTKQGNDFFINVAEITTAASNGNLYTYNETTGTIATGNFTSPLGNGPLVAGALLVKDMGKTVTVSGDTYRKVQAFSVAGATDATLANYTFYILLTPATGNVCEWARMTLQA
jgi:hypothetical protein